MVDHFNECQKLVRVSECSSDAAWRCVRCVVLRGSVVLSVLLCGESHHFTYLLVPV